jgi:nicotinamide-nucleotide amidase
VLGLTIDTNVSYLARAFAAAGVRVSRTASVPDVPGAIRDAVAGGLARTGCVITSGGLGPTRDDMTKRTIADLFELPLVTDAPYLAQLEARWQRLGRGGSMPEANRTQAEHPAGAVLLPNPHGTAPGLWLEGPPGTVVMLPGVPHEFRALADAEVLPRLAAQSTARTVTRSRVLRTTGITESGLADRIGPLEAVLAPVTVAYLPSFDGTDLRLTAWQVAAADAETQLARAAAVIADAVGDRIYGEGDTDLAAVVLDRATADGIRVAVAESCTGGLVGGRLTAVPGASTVFMGGLVAYADDVKVRELGVSRALLDAEGAVSEGVVRAMLDGVRARFDAEAAVAVSGVAGPDGGTAAKPVGTVWLGAACRADVRVVRIGFPGNRQEIRARAAQAALDLLREVLPSVDASTG